VTSVIDLHPAHVAEERAERDRVASMHPGPGDRAQLCASCFMLITYTQLNKVLEAPGVALASKRRSDSRI
jgi:hypothetical protein